MESQKLTLTREACAARDAQDSLAPFFQQFHLPEGIIYLDGNSLGALPRAAAPRLAAAISEEWGDGLIRSWNSAGWYEMPRRVGAKIAGLIGAEPGEVIVADSTSINLFKVLAAALRLNPGRRVILSDPDNFPTDLYIAQGLIDLLGGEHELRLVEPAEVAANIDEQTAVVMLTEVNYRSGERYDMAAITQQAHQMGALVIWDLAHSAGAMPIDLNGAGVDFAVGCGYKYLNGGPGAPAFLFVAGRHQAGFSQPLSGWLGHANPFAFTTDYQPAEGVARYLCGTQPVLSMTALESGIDLMLEADMQAIREKSLALTDLFIELVEAHCVGHGLVLATPRDHARRGSQVSLRHPQGYPIVQALIDAGVIGDFRTPDILRFGFAPLYVRYVDVWDAVEHLGRILEEETWRAPQFQQRAAVT